MTSRTATSQNCCTDTVRSAAAAFCSAWLVEVVAGADVVGSVGSGCRERRKSPRVFANVRDNSVSHTPATPTTETSATTTPPSNENFLWHGARPSLHATDQAVENQPLGETEAHELYAVRADHAASRVGRLLAQQRILSFGVVRHVPIDVGFEEYLVKCYNISVRRGEGLHIHDIHVMAPNALPMHMRLL